MALGLLGPLSANQIIHAPSTDGVANLSLTSGVSTQVAIPANARVVAFAFSADIWVTYGASTAGAISPSSGTSAGSTASAEFNPTVRYLPGNTTGINIYSDFTCKGSVSFYS